MEAKFNVWEAWADQVFKRRALTKQLLDLLKDGKVAEAIAVIEQQHKDDVKGKV